MDVVKLVQMTTIGLNVCRNLSAILGLLSFEVVSVSQVKEDSVS